VFGIFLITNESILLESSTTIFSGYSTVGLIILICVGDPSSYFVILDLFGMSTFTLVPLASTYSRLSNEERSIVPVRFTQFCIENVTRS